jgi:PAS domain S-box-containing protein
MTLTDMPPSAPRDPHQQQIADLLKTQERLQTTIETHYVSQETHERQMKDLQRLQNRLQSDLDITRCQLRAALDSVNDGVALCDVTGYFEVFNDRMQEITGYSKEEANQHMDFQLVLYPDPKRYHQAIMRMAAITASGDPQSCITTIRTKDGVEKTLTVYTSRVECGQQEWLLSTYQDITEYRKLKQKMIRSQKRRRKSVRV